MSLHYLPNYKYYYIIYYKYIILNNTYIIYAVRRFSLGIKQGHLLSEKFLLGKLTLHFEIDSFNNLVQL